MQKIIFNVTPQTHVRATQGDRVFFRIPRERLRPSGLKRLQRLERYNEYKIAILSEAKRLNFSIPAQGTCITFFLPCPKTWSNKKKKLHHFKLHQSKPDLDNLTKAFLDSLLAEDKAVAHYGELQKRWVNFPLGWIEVTITKPTEDEYQIPLSRSGHL